MSHRVRGVARATGQPVSIETTAGVAARLRADEALWLTTVDGRGQPQSSPVWFHWDGSDLLVLTEPASRKVANIAANPRVSIHLEGSAPGTDVVTIEGTASLPAFAPPARIALYGDKYREACIRMGTDVPSYVARFTTVIVVTPTRARVFRSL